MVSGFLVRHDGALISIDDIILIVMDPQAHVVPTKYRIILHLRENHRIQWNKNLLREEEAKELLHELQQLIRKAIEL